MDENLPLIEDPLAWQADLDSSGESINMRGSARFWKTVSHLLNIDSVYKDGAPDFTEIIFSLTDNVGLRLWTGPIEEFDELGSHPVIYYEFCELPLEVD